MRRFWVGRVQGFGIMVILCPMIFDMVSSNGIMMLCHCHLPPPRLGGVLQFRGDGVLVGYCPCVVFSVILHRMGCPLTSSHGPHGDPCYQPEEKLDDDRVRIPGVCTVRIFFSGAGRSLPQSRYMASVTIPIIQNRFPALSVSYLTLRVQRT